MMKGFVMFCWGGGKKTACLPLQSSPCQSWIYDIACQLAYDAVDPQKEPKVFFQYLSSMLLCYIKPPLKHDIHSFLDVESLRFAKFTPCLAQRTRIQPCHLPTWGWGIRPRFPVVQANLTHRFFCQKIKSSTCQPTQMTLQTHSGSGSNNVMSDSTSGQWRFSGHHGQKNLVCSQRLLAGFTRALLELCPF